MSRKAELHVYLSMCLQPVFEMTNWERVLQSLGVTIVISWSLFPDKREKRPSSSRGTFVFDDQLLIIVPYMPEASLKHLVLCWVILGWVRGCET